MTRLRKVIIVNDKSIYNTRYRLELIKKINKYYSSTSLGFFDSYYLFLKVIFKVIFSRETVLISSNLKSNLIMLTFFWKKKLILLNGLGRFRKSKFLRYSIIFLIKLQNQNTVINIQNYADYRYFRKYSKNDSILSWMPGSGGSKRLVGDNIENVSVITRDEKLSKQLDSIEDFCSSFWSPKMMIIIGIKNIKKFTFKTPNYQTVGYVAQSEILKFSKNIFIPIGYGDGIPHTLVDAITSDANIYMSKKSFIQYGFYHFTTFKRLIGSNIWINLVVNTTLKDLVNSESITESILEQIKNLE